MATRKRKTADIKLSIIIPAYNAEPYITELLDCLEKQITDEVQVIVVDDGSDPALKIDRPWVKLIRQTNKGVSAARNRGLTASKGELIQFIDADDLVADNFVETLLNKLKTEEFDYIEYSWKSLPGGIQYDVKLHNENSKLPNPSACTRGFKRSFIGDVRFNVKKGAAEDEEFTRKLDLDSGKRAVVTDYMYFYRTSPPDSKSKKMFQGLLETKRILYNYNHIRKDMTWLLEEVKKADETDEVIVFCITNEIPELVKYAQVMSPRPIRVMEVRGEPTKYAEIIPMPVITQVVLYKSSINLFGGIETFMLNFCENMAPYYDITVVYNECEMGMLKRLSEKVRCEKMGTFVHMRCDTLLMMSILDDIPRNIEYKRSIQVQHACKMGFPMKHDRNEIIPVSKAVADSWNLPHTPIKNMVAEPKPRDLLFLVSATRLDTSEKGEKRMLQLATKLNEKGIPFLWLYFSNRDVAGAPKNMIRMQPTSNVIDYIAKATYLVQLSDHEAFCYSIVEALTMGVPVITTPISVLPEIGVQDGQNAHVVPYNMDFDVEILLDVPKFEYDYDNKPIIEAWRKELGNTTPKKDYTPSDAERYVEVTVTYKDVFLDKVCQVGEIVRMPKFRAVIVQSKGFGRILS